MKPQIYTTFSLPETDMEDLIQKAAQHSKEGWTICGGFIPYNKVISRRKTYGEDPYKMIYEDKVYIMITMSKDAEGEIK